MKLILTALIVAIASVGMAFPASAERNPPVVEEITAANWSDILVESDEFIFDSRYTVVLTASGFVLAPLPNGVASAYAYFRDGDTVVLAPLFGGGFYEVFLEAPSGIACGFDTVINETERVRFHSARECGLPVA